MTKEEKMYLRIHNLCVLLGMVLPWLALFSAGIADHPSSDWWWSISATYYQSPALVGVLVPASLVLMCYIGYDDVDNWITSLSGIFGLGIVLIACNSIFLFTKSGETQTDRKRIRNIIYRVCGYGMLVLEIVLAVFMLCKVPKFTVMIIEILLLSLFGFAWLVKGRAFPFLNDKKEDEEVLPVR